MINVQLEPNGPITQMRKADLVCKTGSLDTDKEHTTWIEYWLAGRCVHRSAHVTLKYSLPLMITQGDFLRG